MAQSGVLRPGHVQLRVLDLESALAHYRDVIGLVEVERGPDGRAYLKGWDEFDHHSLVLREATSPGMDLLAFKVRDEASLDALERAVGAFGLEVEHLPAGSHRATGRRIAFTAPTGHRIELYALKERVGNGLPETNPDVWPDGLAAMHPSHLDHCLLYGDDIEGSVRLFTQVLGFGMAERVVTPDGGLIAAFLSCGNKTHDVAFVKHAEKNKFHHVSFYLPSGEEVFRAADIIRKNKVRIDIGPTRHGITRGYTIYFFDPSGNRNEVFAGGYLYYPDRPTITWTADQLGRGIFYYEDAINERFLS
ncbi:MAG: catechol 2,3-dioxygenase, partial [Alphaproteobacteria bacterium]